MSLEKKYKERLEEVRFQAFSALTKLVDEFVANHYGDKPQLVQYALCLEFIEAIATYSVVNKMDINHIIQLLCNCYNKYMNELEKEKEGS